MISNTQQTLTGYMDLLPKSKTEAEISNIRLIVAWTIYFIVNILISLSTLGINYLGDQIAFTDLFDPIVFAIWSCQDLSCPQVIALIPAIISVFLVQIFFYLVLGKRSIGPWFMDVPTLLSLSLLTLPLDYAMIELRYILPIAMMIMLFNVTRSKNYFAIVFTFIAFLFIPLFVLELDITIHKLTHLFANVFAPLYVLHLL